MKFTISDIAKMTGLSKSTISAVLNSRPGVNAQTKRRVLEVIERVNYIPNEMARGLSNRNSATIGIIARDVTNPFYAKIFRAVEKVADHHSYSVLLSNTDGDMERESRLLKSLIGKRVDGIILDLNEDNLESILELKKSKIPFVVFGTNGLKLQADCVYANDTKGAFEATEYLIQQGHRKIGYVSGQKNSIYSRHRMDGIKDAFLKHDIAYNGTYMFEEAKNLEDGYQVGQRLLQLQDRPTAVIAYNDLVAAGIIKAFTAAGRSIPQDLSVVGFDDIDMMVFPLTTVSIPVYEMGEQAAMLLFDRIHGNEDKPYASITMDTKLIVRDSVRPLHLQSNP